MREESRPRLGPAHRTRTAPPLTSAAVARPRLRIEYAPDCSVQGGHIDSKKQQASESHASSQHATAAPTCHHVVLQIAPQGVVLVKHPRSEREPPLPSPCLRLHLPPHVPPLLKGSEVLHAPERVVSQPVAVRFRRPEPHRYVVCRDGLLVVQEADPFALSPPQLRGGETDLEDDSKDGSKDDFVDGSKDGSKDGFMDGSKGGSKDGFEDAPTTPTIVW